MSGGKKRKNTAISAKSVPSTKAPVTLKKQKVVNPFEGLIEDEPPSPSLGTRKYTIQSSADWTSWYKDTYHADLRPATSQLEVRYKTSTNANGKYTFNISNREDAKNRVEDVKLNPFFTSTSSSVQDIYYSRQNPKFSKPGKRKKIALDDIPNADQPAFAKDILRVMKGTAHTKSLESAHTNTALLAGGLISTSERGRNPYNPINAHIELYKVKHGQRKLEDIFDKDSGSFVAARMKGAEASRKLVDSDFLGKSLVDDAMKDIYDKRVAAAKGDKHAKHGAKSFEDWVRYKAAKWAGHYPAKK